MSYPVMDVCVPWSLVKGGFHKSPSLKSLVADTAAGRGASALSMRPYATWAFAVDLNLVEGGESVRYSVLQKFLGCFLATAGRAGLFLFTDPNDNTVGDTDPTNPGSQSLLLNVTPGAAAPMGISGDGTSTQFQLARQIDQGVDIIQNASDIFIFVNGALQTDVTLGSTGVVEITPAPPANAVLAWTGSFQYLCRFADDTLKDLARVNKNSSGFLWSCGAVSFESEFV